MKIVDHIVIIEKGVPLDMCEVLIQAFNIFEQNRTSVEPAFVDGDKQLEGGSLARSDTQMFLEAVEVDLAKKFNTFLKKRFQEYTDVYRGILLDQDPVSSWMTKIQRTKPGEGYHQWHCENGSFINRDRVVSWMVYLNTIPSENGGGTDFLHQKFTIQPEAGMMVFWPAAYTHMHRGGFLTGDITKYIVTGWFNREPGQTARNLL